MTKTTPSHSWFTSEWPGSSASIAEKQRRRRACIFYTLAHAAASLSVLVLGGDLLASQSDCGVIGRRFTL
jgi:hypothetical protein